MASLVLKVSTSLDGYITSADGSSDWIAAGRTATALDVQRSAGS